MQYRYELNWIRYIVSCETLRRESRGQKIKDRMIFDIMCGITYITLSYYVNILTYTYNFNKYIYEKTLLSLILSIICNALRNFMQPLARKGVYNDLLQPRFLIFRSCATRLYRPLPWASRILVLLVIHNQGYFQTIRIYDFRILRIADTSRNLITVILPSSIIYLTIVTSYHQLSH